MIKNMKDLKAALSFLDEENFSYPSIVSDKMNAFNFNLSFKIIQNQLDNLYEKIRTVEEIDTFSRDYFEKEIDKKKESLQESLKIVEDISLTFQNKDSVSILIPFNNTDEIITDRDGTTVTHMVVNNKKLEPRNNLMADALLANIFYSSNFPCYNNSYKNLINKKLGMSFYSVKEPVQDGIKEIVTVTLLSPQECNYISIEPVNCQISDVKIYDENKTEYKVEVNSYFEKKKITDIIFTVTGKNFVREFKSGNMNSYENNIVSGGIYDHLLNRETIKQIEKSQSNMEKKYIVSDLEEKCDTWNRINKNIDRKNISLARME